MALAALLVSFTLLHFGFYQHRLIVDTLVYQRYGDAMVDGQVPYRDFRLEYPPGALPAFAAARARAAGLRPLRELASRC